MIDRYRQERMTLINTRTNLAAERQALMCLASAADIEIADLTLARDKALVDLELANATVETDRAALEAEAVGLRERIRGLQQERDEAHGWRTSLTNELLAARAEIAALRTQTASDIERWRTLYRALAWMLNDYIGVTDSLDYTEKHERLGYAHEGYHNAQRVIRENKPPVPERLQRFNDGTGCLYGGNSHPDRCVCQEKEGGLNRGTPHKHYDEPPYSCARCGECEAYEPALPLASAPATPAPEET